MTKQTKSQVKNQIKIPNKSLIFLKSSVVVMGIFFIVLFFALIILKQKKSTSKENICQKYLKLEEVGEIDKMELQGNNIIILTKPNSKTQNQPKKQEIIKIDSNCLAIINRIELR